MFATVKNNYAIVRNIVTSHSLSVLANITLHVPSVVTADENKSGTIKKLCNYCKRLGKYNRDLAIS